MVIISNKERIRELISKVDGDRNAIALIKEVPVKALGYVSAVLSLELYLLIMGDEFDKSEVERLDQLRTLAHNSLIDSIRICNRYLFQKHTDIPPGGIYTDNPDHLKPVNRRSIGNWAGRLVGELFDRRR